MDAKTVLDKVGTHLLRTYIERRQATEGRWVELFPIMEVSERETGYKVGTHRETLWRQTTARNQLSATLKYILSAAIERCWEYGRHGDTGGGERDVEESEDGSGSNGYWYDGR